MGGGDQTGKDKENVHLNQTKKKKIDEDIKGEYKFDLSHPFIRTERSV